MELKPRKVSMMRHELHVQWLKTRGGSVHLDAYWVNIIAGEVKKLISATYYGLRRALYHKAE